MHSAGILLNGYAHRAVLSACRHDAFLVRACQLAPKQCSASILARGTARHQYSVIAGGARAFDAMVSHGNSAAGIRLASTDATAGTTVQPRVRGVTLHKASGMWRAAITVNGERLDLGSFADARAAGDAYEAARAVYRDKQYSSQRTRSRARSDAAAQAEAASPALAVEALPAPAAAAPAADATAPANVLRSRFMGVQREEGHERWEAVLIVDGQERHGGEYDTEEEAARAHDALARMYLGPSAATNFPVNPYEAWVPDDAVAGTGHIEARVGQPLTVEEVTSALTAERGVDVTSLNLSGHSDLADHMVFVTGRSVLHMRKMADTIARALRKRRLPGLDAHVEARDMDDWMVVDAGNIIVNVMDAEARAAFDLENFYKSLRIGQDPYAGMTFDEWLAANPVPEVWLRKLERDDADSAAGAQPLPPPASTLVASMGPTFGKPREASSGVRPSRSRGGAARR